MIQIPCPYCGLRNANEFASTGEVKPRPDVATATPAVWRAYLYDHTNPEGWVTEGWYHRAGCRKFLVVERHTQTNEIRSARPAGVAS